MCKIRKDTNLWTEALSEALRFQRIKHNTLSSSNTTHISTTFGDLAVLQRQKPPTES